MNPYEPPPFEHLKHGTFFKTLFEVSRLLVLCFFLFLGVVKFGEVVGFWVVNEDGELIIVIGKD